MGELVAATTEFAIAGCGMAAATYGSASIVIPPVGIAIIVLIVGGIIIHETGIDDIIANGVSSLADKVHSFLNEEKNEADVLEYRLPSWKKVKVDMNHIISGHTAGGGRGEAGGGHLRPHRLFDQQRPELGLRRPPGRAHQGAV